jgi:hypothetical protein
VLIDTSLPKYEFRETHRIIVRASACRVYTIARQVDCRRLPLTLALFFLRGLPGRCLWPRVNAARFEPTLDGLIKMGFVFLAERPGVEFVLGAAGRFWTAHGDLESLGPRDFSAFHRAGSAKMVWNFHLADAAPGAILLTTETRILPLDDESRRRFRRYWLLIRPFSGMTRIEILRSIKRRAEHAEGVYC